MNQLENNSRRNSSASRHGRRVSDKSGSRPAARSTAARGGASGSRSRNTSSYRSSQSGRGNSYQSSRRGTTHRRRKGPDYTKIALIGVILIVVITCIALALKGRKPSPEETEAVTTEAVETEMQKEVRVDGITITGMSRSQAREAVLAEFPWSMTVSYGEDTYQVTDLMAAKVDALLDEIYSGEPEEDYTLDTTGLEEQAAAEAAACAAKWDKKAKNGSISSFDKEKNQFVFAGEENGFAIDQEKLASDILAAVEKKDFDASIEAAGAVVSPEITAASAKEKYKTISSVTTNTTANKNRNTNVRLAAEAINGTVLQPGEEFSFNGVVGQRTEAKGYKGAAAYNNGEVVQEIGGGVCQISTTLYNAVYRAGLEISFRRSHTFEPNYITPGQDATVSWEQPDFKFINNSSTAIGIRASYADQKATVSIYGIPILEEGIKWDLVSEKVEELDPPAPTYEEDQTLQPGVEEIKSAGTKGSRWQTYKVVYKDGKEISRELDHKTTYKGHAPVIRRNTTGIVLAPEETTTSAETPVPTVDGMPEGYVPGDVITTLPVEGGTGSQGPGVSTSAPAPSAEPSVSASSAAVKPSEAENAGPDSPGAVVPAGQGPDGGGAVIAPLKPE